MKTLHLIWYILQHESDLNKVFFVDNTMTENEGLTPTQAVKNLSAYWDVADDRWYINHDHNDNTLYITFKEFDID